MLLSRWDIWFSTRLHECIRTLASGGRTLGWVPLQSSCFDIGLCYMSGNGVGMDEKRAVHYYELSAMGGHAKGRHNLGYYDGNAGNYHWA